MAYEKNQSFRIKNVFQIKDGNWNSLGTNGEYDKAYLTSIQCSC